VAELFVETNELSFPGDTIEDHFSLDEQVVVDTWEACVRGGHEADEILEALEDRWPSMMINGSPKQCQRYLKELQTNRCVRDTHEHCCWAIALTKGEACSLLAKEVARWD